MNTEVLGRTNTVFPKTWLALAVPDGGFAFETPLDFIRTAREANLPLDISSQPALWGGCARGAEELIVIQQSTYQLERATSEEHAMDLVQAHLIETLSAIGREYLDFYFLRVRRALEEFQINGALAALEAAREEGHLKYLGLNSTGNPLAALGFWQFHDAFEVVMIPRSLPGDEAFTTLAPLANQRRVGIVSRDCDNLEQVDTTQLFTVRSSEEIQKVLA